MKLPLVLASLLVSLAAAQASCSPGWVQGEFPLAGVDGSVAAMTTFDDGSGPALFVGGAFSFAGAVPASNIAKWNGSAWSAVGTGLDGGVNAMVVWNDGNGPALYVGGGFSTAGGVNAAKVARWNGTAWSAVGTVVMSSQATVNALAIYDDGSGPKLYAGGTVGIACWNGWVWTGVGGGINGSVRALASCNGVSGPRLYASGVFTTAGTVQADKIACWNGTLWSNLGSGPTTGGFITALAGIVALATWNDGTGENLFAGGDFTTIAGFAASALARWNGTAWIPLAYPLPPGANAAVLATLPTASGTALHTVFGCGVQRLTASGWSALPCLSVQGMTTLATFDQGSGPVLWAATTSGSVRQLTGSGWGAIGGGLTGVVQTVAQLNDGTGEALYAGTRCPIFDGVGVDSVWKRVGSSWAVVGPGMSNAGSSYGALGVAALASFDGGGGPRIHAGGNFTFAGSVPALNVARWDGSAWSPLGPGLSGGAVSAMVVGDLGNGPRLFVGGNFLFAGTLAVNGIAQWDGSSWSALGTGMTGAPNGQAWVKSLVVHDDGSGPALYAGGHFITAAGGIPLTGIARWNGTSWAPVGSNGAAAVALAVHDDGAGPALYTTGAVGSAAAIVKWDGTSWSSIGTGLFSPLTIASFDDGSGPALYIAGENTPFQAGISRWNGLSWSTPGGGLSGSITGSTWPAGRSLTVADDGGGPALFVGGEFTTAGGQVSAGVAKWTAGGPPIVKVQPLAQNVNPGAPLHLSVTAIGAPPLGYQWRKDGAAVPGAVGPTVAVPTTTPGAIATYDVVITNPCGTTTSQPAYVVVRSAILTMTQPYGAGSILVANTSGIPGSSYFSAFTFDSANLVNPGNGFWLGLHIPYPELLSQFATQTPPFVGVLDANGGSAFALPGGAIAPSLSGARVFALTAIYDPVALTVIGGSEVESRLLQ
jgi:trimeric autotransporter adhesin